MAKKGKGSVLIITLTQYRIMQEEGLYEELAGLCWPVGLSGKEYLDFIN